MIYISLAKRPWGQSISRNFNEAVEQYSLVATFTKYETKQDFFSDSMNGGSCIIEFMKRARMQDSMYHMTLKSHFISKVCTKPS